MGAIISINKKNELIPIIQSNLGKISQREIARRLGVGKTAINRWSSELGFKFAKNTVNEAFFDEWCENSAYVLGYIFADGNVSWNPKKGYQSLTITAAEKDKDHLEKVRLALSSTKPLIYAKKTKSYRMIANSRQLCLKLMKLGVVPAKSLIVKFPEVPAKYLRHFIRGVIDGDGIVRYVSRKRSPYFEISISSGSRKFLETMSEQIQISIHANAKIRLQSGNTYILPYSCQRGKDLAKWIYDDATIFLQRKFEKYSKNVKQQVV